MALSAEFTVNGSSAVQAHTTTYGGSVSLVLSSLTGVNTIAWSIAGTSHSGMSEPAITLSGTPNGASASFSMPSDPGDGEGRAVVVKCTVTDSGGAQAVSYRVVGVANDNGLVPACVGEENYRDATHGWTGLFNSALASTGGGASINLPDDPADDGKVAIADSADFVYVGGSAVGQVLRWTGSGAAFGAVDLADTDAITGLLPLARITGGTAVGQVLRNATGNVPEWGALNLADTDAVTGKLPLTNIADGDTEGDLLYWDGSEWISVPSTTIGGTSIPVIGLVEGTGGTIAQDNRTLIQAALDSAVSGTTGRVVQLPAGAYYIDRPLRVPAYVILAGCPGRSATRIRTTFHGGPVILLADDGGACPHGPALLTGEDWSLNLAESAGSETTPRLLDYGQTGVAPYKWDAFNFECTFQVHGTLVDTQTLFCIGGRRTSAEGYTTALRVWFLDDGTLCADVRIGGRDGVGTDYALASAAGAITVGTTYHVCVDYDGTTIRLWLAIPGGAASLVDSQAATGEFTASGYEVPVMGPAAYEQFPEPSTYTFDPVPAYVGGHRFGPTSKRSSAYTAPSVAYTPDSSDWICFVATTDGTHGKEIGDLYYTKFRTAGAWLRLMRVGYAPIEHAGVMDLNIDGSAGTAGRGLIGVLGVTAQNSRIVRVYAEYVGQGIILQNNCYLSLVRDCDTSGGKTSWGGPTGSEIRPRIGVALSGASGVMHAYKLKIAGASYGFVNNAASVEGSSIWVIETYETKALFYSPTTMQVSSLMLADEGDSVDNDYALLIELSGVGHTVTFTGLTIECASFPAVPIGVSGAENGGDYRTQLLINGARIFVDAADCDEAVHFLNPTKTRPVIVNGIELRPHQVPITLSPGMVMRDGAPKGSVALTDANATIEWYQGKRWALASGTLTTDRTLALGKAATDAGPHDCAILEVIRKDTSRFSYAVTNGSGGSTLFTFPPGKTGKAVFQNGGTDWELVEYWLDVSLPSDTISTSTPNATPVDVRTYTIPTNTTRVFSVEAHADDGTNRLLKIMGFSVRNVAGTVSAVGSDDTSLNNFIPSGWAFAHSETGATTKLTATGPASAADWSIKVWWEDAAIP